MKIGAEKKEAILQKLLHNADISLRNLAKESQVGYSTLCKWRREVTGTKTKQDKTQEVEKNGRRAISFWRLLQPRV